MFQKFSLTFQTRHRPLQPPVLTFFPTAPFRLHRNEGSGRAHQAGPGRSGELPQPIRGEDLRVSWLQNQKN